MAIQKGILAGKEGAVGVLLHFHQPPINMDGMWMSNIKKMWQKPVDDADKWNIACYVGSYRALPKSVCDLANASFNPYVMADYSGILLYGINEAESEEIFTQMAQEKQGSQAGNIISELRCCDEQHPYHLELLATGFYHPLFHPAVTPKADWKLHIEEYKNLHNHLLNPQSAENLYGFWPPEMAIPGNKEDIFDLIEVLHACGIQWIAIPSVPYRDPENMNAIQPVEGRQMGFYERFYAPHVLKGKKHGRENQIVTLTRDPRSEPNKGVDIAGRIAQVSVEYARELQSQGRKAWFPPIVLICGDGENGSEMMQGNFFRNTFNPYVMSRPENSRFVLTTGTSYLSAILEEAFGKPDWSRADEIFSEIKIQADGYSWSGILGNIWLSRPEKRELYRQIFRLSDTFHSISLENIDFDLYCRVRHMVLRTQTSCYTWWNSEFWLNQGRKAIEDGWKAIDSLR